MAASNPLSPAGTVSRSVTGSSANVALAKAANHVMVSSPATNAIAFINFGTSSAVTAAVTDTPILPGSVQVFSTGVNITYVAAIGTSGSTLYFTSCEGN